MVGEVREYDELAGIYEKLDTVRITTSRVFKSEKIKNVAPAPPNPAGRHPL